MRKVSSRQGAIGSAQEGVWAGEGGVGVAIEVDGGREDDGDEEEGESEDKPPVDLRFCGVSGEVGNLREVEGLGIGKGVERFGDVAARGAEGGIPENGSGEKPRRIRGG